MAMISEPTADERALVESLRRGDGRAYEQLVREYGGAMLAVARRFLRDEDDARDAVQDAMVAAFKAMRFFREDARLSTWLHRITVNACLMKMRAARRRPTARIDDVLPRFDDSGHRIEEDTERASLIEDAIDAPLVRTRVRACIQKLPDAYRAVLLCRDIEELDTAETAKLLGISPENVKTRLHRARQALRGMIETECAELVA
jgi:RNA polymerase sigma-70 factor (ECF subfamily)